MDKLQLAMLTQWAEEAGLGGIQGRKRMQKVVFFLKQAGCPLSAEFTLHHYGPYSRDVAEMTDIMVGENLLDESNGGQFVYKLNQQTPALITSSRSRSPERVAAFEKYREMALELLREDLWQLELGSTVLYFFQAEQNWEVALTKACDFKKVDSTSPQSVSALKLAQRIGERAA
jgi:uncharacterized protein